MIYSIIIGEGGIIVMMILWVMVQSQWRETFIEEIEEADVLAHRRSCGDCGCGTSCRIEKIEQQN